MKGYITQIEDLVGKTVDKVLERGSDLLLRFDDKTWTVLESRVEPYEGSCDTPTIKNKAYIGLWEQKDLGIITPEEFAELSLKASKAHNRSIIRREKQEYERLKAKFEK